MLITTQLEENEENDFEEEIEEEYEIVPHVPFNVQRDALAQYFISNESSVEWQDRYI